MLLITAAKKDPAYFAPLYNRYYRPIIQFVYRRLYDKEKAADIVSMVFLKALNNLSSYENRGLPFSSWLFRIAVNELNYYYRTTSNKRIVGINDEQLKAIPLDSLEGNEEEKIEKILCAIKKLKEDEVQYIELRFFEGYSFKEIADILSITENNAKVRTYRIIEKIKKWV
jgi:RNA polymerase sigma-70 factor (ECF subfamily)